MSNLKKSGILGLMAMMILPLIGISSAAAQQQLKFGYTNAELVLYYMPEWQNAEKTLSDKRQQYGNELQTLQAGLQQKLQQYQSQMSLLNEEGRKVKENELKAEDEKIRKKANDYDQELAKLQQSLQNPLTDRINAAIETVSKRMNLALVMNASNLLYANSDVAVDITEELFKELGLPLPTNTAGAATPGQ